MLQSSFEGLPSTCRPMGVTAKSANCNTATFSHFSRRFNPTRRFSTPLAWRKRVAPDFQVQPSLIQLAIERRVALFGYDHAPGGRVPDVQAKQLDQHIEAQKVRVERGYSIA